MLMVRKIIRRMGRFKLSLFLFLGSLPTFLSAHKLETGQAVLTITPDLVWILELEVNLTRYIQSNPELAENVRPYYNELESEGVFKDVRFSGWERVFINCENQFRKEIQVLEDEERIQNFELWFPHPSELSDQAFETMQAEGLHVKVFATGKLSTEETLLQFRFPMDIGEVVLTTLKPEVQWVITGEFSEPISMGAGAGFSFEDEGRSSVFRYLKVGFIHIIPEGLDHILFVIGLFLLAARFRPLLIQVTCFTLAHTLTLGLSIYGVISLPSSVVEPLIALSIALVAFENVFTSKIRPWRPVLVFLFGLLHGLGFAGVLSEIGLPRDEFLFALVFFNIGVELGQLFVIVAAFVLIGLFRKKEWYRARLTVPLSCIIGLVGLYWTVERIFF